MALLRPLPGSAASSATLFAAGALLCDAGDPRRSARSAAALLLRARAALDAVAAATHAHALARALAAAEEVRACCIAAARAAHRARAFPGTPIAAAPLMTQNRDALSDADDATDGNVERHIRAALARAAAALAAAERILGAADGAGVLLLRPRTTPYEDDDDGGDDDDADADAEEEEAESLWRGWAAFGAHPFFSHGRARARAEALFRRDANAPRGFGSGSGNEGADAGGGSDGGGARVAGYFVALRAAAAAATLWRLAREQRSRTAAAASASASASDVAVADRCAAAVLRALRLARHVSSGHAGVHAARAAMLLLPWEADAAHAIEALLASSSSASGGASAHEGGFSSAWAAQRCVAAAWAGGARLRGSARAHAALCARDDGDDDGDGDGDGSPAAVFHARRAPPVLAAALRAAPPRACALPACGAREAHAHAHMVCSRCRVAAYCCAAHAAAHWRTAHRAQCAALSQRSGRHERA
jgi:hypothetical protein